MTYNQAYSLSELLSMNRQADIALKEVPLKSVAFEVISAHSKFLKSKIQFEQKALDEMIRK